MSGQEILDEEATAVHSRRGRILTGARGVLQLAGVTLFTAFFLKTFVVEAYRIPSSSMENTLLVGDFIMVNKFQYGAMTPVTIPFTGIPLPHFRLPAVDAPRRGDVMVFRFPGERDEPAPTPPITYVKRCIAIPGDTIRIVDKQVYINGWAFAPVGTVKTSPDRLYPAGFIDHRIFPRGYPYNEDNYGPLVVPSRGMRIALDPAKVPEWWSIVEREGHKVTLTDGGAVLVDGTPASTYEVCQDHYFVMGDNRDNSLDSRFWGFVSEEHLVGKAMMLYWSWDVSGPRTGPFGRFSSVRWDRIGRIIR